MKPITLIPILSLTIICVLQVHNLMTLPIERGFDSKAHLEYIGIIKNEHRFPTANEGWETSQPPLYYLLASGFKTELGLKTLGFLIWLMMAWMVWIASAELYQPLRLSLVALTAALPVQLTQSLSVSNEYLSGFLISLFLVLSVYPPQTSKLKWWMSQGLILGLILLAKATSLVLLGAYIVKNRFKFKQLSIVLSIVMIIGGWFYLRNIVFYGSPTYSAADFTPLKNYAQPIVKRSPQFVFNLQPLFLMRLSEAKHESLIVGTFFSWFYDGHTIIVPPQSFSKAGSLIVAISLVWFGTAIMGCFEIGKSKTLSKKYQLLMIYVFLLIAAYVWYNFKLPFYSTVKGSFLLSLVIPFAMGVKEFLLHRKEKWIEVYFVGQVLVYVAIIAKHFWVKLWWY